MADQKVEQPPQYFANYWEDDTTLNPKIVRLDSRQGEFFNITLPNGEGERHVHLHTLGRPHRAF